MSAAQITITKDTTASGERMVIIKGTPKAIDKARQMIDDALSRTDNFNPSSLRLKAPSNVPQFDESQDVPTSLPLRRSSHNIQRKIMPLDEDKKSVSVPAFKFSEVESQRRTAADTSVDQKMIRGFSSAVVSREPGQILHATSEPQFAEIALSSHTHVPLTAVASAPPSAVNTHGQPSNANGDTLTSDHPKRTKTVRTFSAPPSSVAGRLESPYGHNRLSPNSSLASSTSGSSSGLQPGDDEMHRSGSPFAIPFGPDGPVGGYGAIGSNKKNSVPTTSSVSGTGDTEEVASAAVAQGCSVW